MPAVKVYANPVADRALRAGKSIPMSVGATVVKERWRLDESRRVAYAAMVKREPGYDPFHGDWEYIYAVLGRDEPTRRGKPADCIECHQSAATEDYLFRSYRDVSSTIK